MEMKSIYVCILVLVFIPCIYSNPLLNDIFSRQKRQADDGTCNQADIIFVLDSSGSIKKDNWLRVLNFTKTVVSGLEIGPFDIRVGCLSFGTKATPHFYLDTYDNKNAMLDAIDMIPYKDQETNTSGALWYMSQRMFAFDRGDRPRAPNLAIVMTDGASNRDSNLTIPYANEIKASGRITVFVIAVGEQTNQDELDAIATNSSYVFDVAGFAMLPAINDQIVSAACDIPVECKQDADIVFMIDGSSSVRQENFMKIQDFIGTLIDLINVEANQSNVAVIVYSTNAQVQFYLDAFNTRSEIKAAVSDVSYPWGLTNTAAALRLAREDVFVTSKGDRPDKPNLLFFFTDGNSNDRDATLEEARLTREAGITIIGVAVTDWIQMAEIREVSTDPDSLNVYQVDRVDDISSLQRPLKEILCDQINECDSRPCKNQGVCVNGINTYHCLCPTGTAGRHCDITCSPVDVVMAIDSSGSIGLVNYYKALSFVKDFSSELNFQDGNARLGIQTFANQNQNRFYLKTYNNKPDIISAISFSYQGGTTNTAQALQSMREVQFTDTNGHRQSARKVGIVLTDGQSNDRDATYSQAVLAKDSGITMLTVAVNIRSRAGLTELNGMTSAQQALNSWNVDTFDGLRNVTLELVNAVCNSEDNCASNPCPPRAQCIDKVNDFECVCPPGWSGRLCDRNCDGQADVIFVIDSSGSIRESRFQIVRDYIISVVNELEISPNKVRVGLIQFSDDASKRFDLNSFTRKEDVIHNVQIMPYTRGRTNIAAALRMLRLQGFIQGNGDRPTVPNYAIIISDGESTVEVQDTLPEAIEARIAGIHLIVVSVGPRQNSLEIKGIATDPDEFNIYSVTNFTQLATKSMPLVNGMCDTVNECDSNPCVRGQCVNGLGQYICFCPNDFTGFKCERSCTRTADVVFILDASGSVEKNFEVALNLTRHIVRGLSFSLSRTRVGIVLYSDDAETKFYLNTHSELIEVENAISFTLLRGRTNTYSGLNEMRQNQFTPFRGDRVGVPNYGITITDGRSNVDNAQTVPEAIAAQNEGITMFAVGIGENGIVDRAEINGIASDPDSRYAYVIENESEVEDTANSILNVMCE